MAALGFGLQSLRADPRVPLYRDWQEALADAVTDLGELCRLVGLEPGALPAERGDCSFPLLVPRTLLGRTRQADPNDPILLQVLPQSAESAEHPGFTADPVNEAEAAGRPGLLWKYQDRVLILTTRRCGVHCRFCFRRHFAVADLPLCLGEWDCVVRQIAAHPTHEVILSGGDPLVLEDEFLGWLARRLAAIPQVQRLRVHTRLPVVIPQRVTDQLLRWLRGTRLTTLVVVHVNHPAEIDPSVAVALGRLVDAGIPVLSQSVLLRGVNDRVEVLAELLERLVNLRVMPYYLHQLDRVAGAAHFEVPEQQGIAIVQELRARLPGYAVPRYVRQPPTGPSKLVLA
ncbi:MAG: EF-P beta-lysylation protein EpmB [Thermoguttaceae bacterium]